MKLNMIERVLVNNPLRAWVQQHFEAPLLQRLGGRVEGGYVLEIGCGRGIGCELLFQQFGARRIQAFDLDPKMVEQACRRLARFIPERLQIDVTDATALPFADEAFDAVFDFGVLHHIPDWQAALAEVRRVLKPEGRFFFEEMTSQALRRWVYRMFLDHPEENRFSTRDLIQELARQNINVGDNFVERWFGDLVIGVGHVS